MKCQNGRSEILLLPTSTLWLSLGVDGLGVPAKEMSTLYFLVYIDIYNVYYTYIYIDSSKKLTIVQPMIARLFSSVLVSFR